MATSSDYAWVESSPFGVAYCLTMVEGLTPHEMFDRLDVLEREDLTGLEALAERAYGMHDGRRQYTGMRNVGDWGLMLEINGFVGVNDPARTTLSRGTQLVSHYRNVNAVSRFVWVGDGELWLEFDPLFPSTRRGTKAAEVAETLRDTGFDFEDFDSHGHDPRGAAFRLAERLTGVALSEDLLDRSEYLCGFVPYPR